MNKLLMIGVSGIILVGAAGVFSVSASAYGSPVKSGIHKDLASGVMSHGRLSTKASILGMSEDELKTALKTKTMSQIALEKGIDEVTFKAKMSEAAEARWKELGLSDEEIAKRRDERELRQKQNESNPDHEFGNGAGKRRGGRL